MSGNRGLGNLITPCFDMLDKNRLVIVIIGDIILMTLGCTYGPRVVRAVTTFITIVVIVWRCWVFAPFRVIVRVAVYSVLTTTQKNHPMDYLGGVRGVLPEAFWCRGPEMLPRFCCDVHPTKDAWCVPLAVWRGSSVMVYVL